MIKRISLAAVVLLVLSIPNIIQACTCMGTPSPCESYAGASAVFIGYVNRVEPDNADIEATYLEQTAYVQVEKSFKGASEGAEIVLHQPSHNCAPKFKAKQRYLMYSDYHDKEMTWEVYGCGRSTSIEYAGDDLLFLYGLPESANKTRISGEITQYEDTPEKGFSRINTLAGLKVKIIGPEKTYEAYTDKNGVYEIYDLPPEKYSIEPEIPFGLKIRFPMPFGPIDYSDRKLFKVELTQSSCAGSDFVMSSDTSLSGKVFGANGEIMPRVCLDLVPADKPADRYFHIFDCTEKDGRYEMKEIPPGKYLVVINNDGKISGDEPFNTAYYPGVFEKERATIITIKEGEKLENYDIHIPSQAPTNVIEGVLLYSDGVPVGHESIEFKGEGNPTNFELDANMGTDEQGHFSIRVLQGTTGWLHGYMLLYFGKYRDCPQANKLLLGKDNRMIKVETVPIKIEVNNDVRNIKLVLPFPFCSRKEKQ